MKKWWKGVALALCVALAASLFCGCKKDTTAFTLDGVAISKDDFRAVHNGEKTLEECESKKDAKVGLSSISAGDGYIAFYMMANMGDSYSLGNFMGQYFGDKTRTDQGIDATVAFVSDSTNALTVLLFQVFNDTAADDELLLHPELSGKPHIKIYLRDSKQNLYFFEGPLPDAFRNMNAEGREAISAYDKWADAVLGTGSIEQEG